MEHNKYCVTVHFRNCEPQYWESVVTTVETFMQTRENLKATRGRKVLEIKPQVGAGFQGLRQAEMRGEARQGSTAGPWHFASRGSIAASLHRFDPAGSFSTLLLSTTVSRRQLFTSQLAARWMTQGLLTLPPM